LGELGFRNNDIITVRRLETLDDSTAKSLLDESRQNLSVEASRIFNEWFDMYSDCELGVMTPESTSFFIRGATNEPVSAADGRI